MKESEAAYILIEALLTLIIVSFFIINITNEILHQYHLQNHSKTSFNHISEKNIWFRDFPNLTNCQTTETGHLYQALICKTNLSEVYILKRAAHE
jgi:hypothetical protein